MMQYRSIQADRLIAKQICTESVFPLTADDASVCSSAGSRGDSDATTAATTASPTLVEFDWSEDDMSQVWT